MKNKVIKLLSVFIFLFIFKINDASAGECHDGNCLCIYGSKDGDTWNEVVRLNVDSDKTYLDLSNGVPPFINRSIIDIGLISSAQTKKNYTFYKINSGSFEAGIYISLQSGISNPNECPASLYYTSGAFIQDGFTGDGHLFYHDLDIEKFKLEEINTSKTIPLIEIDKKDENIKDVISNCYTYTTYIDKIKEVVDKKKSCDNNIEFDDTYKELRSLCDSLRTTSFYNQNDILRKCNTACSLLKDDVDGICASGKSEVKPCGSLGSKIIAWMFKIIKIVRYIVPALIIILSILDFIKALSDEEKMKEATSKFFKRLIAAALIFIVPFILDFILKKFSIPGFSSDNPFCAL